MSDRLSSLDASFLYLEDATTPMHVGSVMVFEPADDGFDYDRLVQLISQRIAFVPRYRQRIRQIPGRLANPVWVDDENFDVNYHVRRSALPRPGSDEQLEEFVARIQPRALDRSRPLWEVYLVEGLEEDRFAIVTKSHQALVDGVNAVDIAHVIVDNDPPLPDAPCLQGDSSDLVYFLSWAFAARYGGSHELSLASLVLRGEFKIDLKPLLNFADREVEEDSDAEMLDKAWQEAAPLAECCKAIVSAFESGDRRLEDLQREYPALKNRIAELGSMARHAAENGSRIRVTYTLEDSE